MQKLSILRTTISELQECRSQLTQGLKTAREHGGTSADSEIGTGEAGLAAVEQLIQERASQIIRRRWSRYLKRASLNTYLLRSSQ